jgi:hypothetical protein
MPLMILNGLEGKPLPIYGDGLNVRDWLYVEDHGEALRQVLARGRVGETYNIGGNCEKTNLEVVQTLCAILDELRPDSPHRPHARLITLSKTGPGTTGAMPSTAAKFPGNWAGGRRSPLKAVWPKRCAGIWTTRTGWPRCTAANTGSGWSCIMAGLKRAKGEFSGEPRRAPCR